MDKRQIKRLTREREGILTGSCASGYTDRTVDTCGCKLCSLEMHKAGKLQSRIIQLQTGQEREEREESS